MRRKQVWKKELSIFIAFRNFFTTYVREKNSGTGVGEFLRKIHQIDEVVRKLTFREKGSF